MSTDRLAQIKDNRDCKYNNVNLVTSADDPPAQVTWPDILISQSALIKMIFKMMIKMMI